MRGDSDLVDRYRDIYTSGKMFDMDEASQTIYSIGPDWKSVDSLVHWRLDCVSHAVKTKLDSQVAEEMNRGGRAKRLRII